VSDVCHLTIPQFMRLAEELAHRAERIAQEREEMSSRHEGHYGDRPRGRERTLRPRTASEAAGIIQSLLGGSMVRH